MSEQSKALELAEILDAESRDSHKIGAVPYALTFESAAKELRRLDAENAALRAQLEGLKLSVAWGHNPFQNAQQAPIDEREAFIADAPIRQKIITLLDCLDGELYLPIESQQELTNEVRASLKPAVPEGYRLVPALAADWPLAVGVKRLLRELSLNTHPRDVVYFTLIDMLAAAKDGEA